MACCARCVDAPTRSPGADLVTSVVCWHDGCAGEIEIDALAQADGVKRTTIKPQVSLLLRAPCRGGAQIPMVFIWWWCALQACLVSHEALGGFVVMGWGRLCVQESSGTIVVCGQSLILPCLDFCSSCSWWACCERGRETEQLLRGCFRVLFDT